MDHSVLTWSGIILSPVLGLLLAWTLTAALRRWAGKVNLARRRAETLLGHLPTALVALDSDGRVTASNAAAEELWGAPLPRGLTWSQLLRSHPWFDFEGVRLAPEEMPLLAALTEGKAAAGVGLIARPGRAAAAIIARAVPLPEAGGSRGALCSFEPAVAAARLPGLEGEPAPALRQSSGPPAAAPLLEELWDTLPDPVLVLAEDDQAAARARIIGVNEAARRCLGLQAETDALCPADELLPRLQLRRPNGEPLAAADWLPLQVLGGGPRREEALLMGPVAGREVALVARAVPFTAAATGRRYALWLPRLVGPVAALGADPAGSDEHAAASAVSP